jgi:hypothetical protein
MKRIACVGILLIPAAPAAWADCHVPKLQSLTGVTLAQVPPCLAPLQKFATQAHAGAGAAARLAALWASSPQAELQDPLGSAYRGREEIQKAFEGTVFKSLLAGAYHVKDGTISHGHLAMGDKRTLEDAGILEWDATIEGAPGEGKHHVRALVVDTDGQNNWAFHTVHVTADITR